MGKVYDLKARFTDCKQKGAEQPVHSGRDG